MKKAFLYCVSAALIFSALTGCARTADEPQPTPEATPIVEPIPEPKEYTLADLTNAQTETFAMYASIYDEPVRLGNMTVAEATKELDAIIVDLVEDGSLPSNGLDLFHQYRDEQGITFPEPETKPTEQQSGSQGQQGSQGTSQGQQGSQVQTPKPNTENQGNKPQASDQQQQQQANGSSSGSVYAPNQEPDDSREQAAARGEDTGGNSDWDTFNALEDYTPID